jgi:hypothetical protein
MARSPQSGKTLFRQRDFPLTKRPGATSTKILINLFIGQDKQKTFPHWHRLSTLAAIESIS